MTVEKQREVIRLWNQLRKVEGPAAEELRIQILECFSEARGLSVFGPKPRRRDGTSLHRLLGIASHWFLPARFVLRERNGVVCRTGRAHSRSCSRLVSKRVGAMLRIIMISLRPPRTLSDDTVRSFARGVLPLVCVQTNF